MKLNPTDNVLNTVIRNDQDLGMGTGVNGNSALGNPIGMGMSQKVENGTGGNENGIDGNGREWEC